VAHQAAPQGHQHLAKTALRLVDLHSEPALSANTSPMQKATRLDLPQLIVPLFRLDIHIHVVIHRLSLPSVRLGFTSEDPKPTTSHLRPNITPIPPAAIDKN
jgi:hypothetical protein